jgi:transcriptional regulator with XRE-family HTH domain
MLFLEKTALDELNLGQAYNQYRSLHKLPIPEEIQEIRSQYGIAATKMAEILGLGTNVYRQYEAGEVPSESNARLIQLAADPLRFQSLVDLCTSLDEKTKEKLGHRIEQLVQAKKTTRLSSEWEEYLFGPPQPDEFSGFRRPNLDKFSAMVAAFSQALKPWKTKLNKLLGKTMWNSRNHRLAISSMASS